MISTTSYKKAVDELMKAYKRRHPAKIVMEKEGKRKVVGKVEKVQGRWRSAYEDHPWREG